MGIAVLLIVLGIVLWVLGWNVIGLILLVLGILFLFIPFASGGPRRWYW